MRHVLFLLAVSAAVGAETRPVRVLIAYHSGTGHTEKLARAIGEGAGAVNGVEPMVRRTADVTAAEILAADGIVIGSPVHWASLTAETKRFLDTTGSALWSAKTSGDNRTAGAFCTGGGAAMGKDTVRLTILSALLAMRYTVVGGVDAHGFGTLGPEATTGPSDPGVGEAEVKDARRFGERFARITAHMRALRP